MVAKKTYFVYILLSLYDFHFIFPYLKKSNLKHRMDWKELQEVHQFWSIDTIHFDVSPIGRRQSIFKANFKLDDHLDQYQRVVYSFFDMTGQIGGVYEIIAIVFGFIINAFNKRMLVYSLIGSLYYTRKPNDVNDTSLNSTFNNLRSNRTTRVEPKLREESKACDTSLNTNKFTPQLSSNLRRSSTFVKVKWRLTIKMNNRNCLILSKTGKCIKYHELKYFMIG